MDNSNEPTWVLQDTNLPVDKLLRLVRALNWVGVRYKTIGVIPFQDELDLTGIDPNETILFYGSEKLVRVISTKYTQYLPGVFYDPKTFNYRTWIDKRGDIMLNHSADFIKIKDLENYVWSDDDPRFIRPIADLKAFSGTLVEKKDITKKVQEISLNYHLFDEDLEIVVSKPINLAYEWRFIVVNHEVVAGSQYRCHNFLKITPEIKLNIWEQARVLADNWLPSGIVTMDIAQTKEGRLKIVEFNCFNASGFYACSCYSIVTAVNEYLKKRGRYV